MIPFVANDKAINFGTNALWPILQSVTITIYEAISLSIITVLYFEEPSMKAVFPVFYLKYNPSPTMLVSVVFLTLLFATTCSIAEEYQQGDNTIVDALTEELNAQNESLQESIKKFEQEHGIKLSSAPTNSLTQNYPERIDTHINDFAELLTNQQLTALQQALEKLIQETGTELTIVTLKTRFTYQGREDSIENFSKGLFTKWNLATNGILVVVAHNDRQMRIQLGVDYGTLHDNNLKRIVDTVFIPNFKAGNFGQGIVSGVAATIEELTNMSVPSNLLPEQDAVVSGKTDWLNMVVFIFGGGTVVWALYYGLYYRRHMSRKCSHCKTKMSRLSENDDDAYLELGAQLEEIVGSVNYDVWKCSTCERYKIVRFDKWFSGYGACRSCGYKTLESVRAIESSATEHTTGRARITYKCETCDFKEVKYETIPRITPADHSSSSFSSSSSSFSSSSSSSSSSSGGASGSW